jgi:sugar transferase (PEP-CTERM/EpsH1 system associated)
LAHRTPYPPNKGEKIRAFNLLSHLAKSHEVTLVYWVDAIEDLAHTPFLRSLCRGPVIPVRLNRPLAMLRALRSLLNGRSFTEGFYGSSLFQHAVDDALRQGPFDAVFVFSSAVACYAANLEAKSKIVDFVDVDSDKWGQLAHVSPFPLSALYRLEKKRLARFEVAVSKWASRSLFVSLAEAELFKKNGGQGWIDFLANGTDLELRRIPLEQIPFHAESSNGATQPHGARLIFVGTMNYYPNIDAVGYFAQEIFPLIRQKLPEAIFEIVGRHPPKAVRRLSRIDGVQVAGEVSDVRSYLIRADVSVAPMRIARGVQNKILEAMALGVPVVATPAAIEGIEVCNGEDVLIGTSAKEFAQQVIELLGNAELRKTITKKAWNTMNQFHNWDLVGSKLERLLNNEPLQDCLPANEDVSVGLR